LKKVINIWVFHSHFAQMWMHFTYTRTLSAGSGSHSMSLFL